MGSSSRPSTAGAAASAEYKRQDVLVPGISSSHKSAAVSALAWSHNGRRLAVASEDGTVRVFAADANGAVRGKGCGVLRQGGWAWHATGDCGGLRARLPRL
jgi:WD40 repeat protein